MSKSILKKAEVLKKIGLGETAFNAMVKVGHFPQPIKLIADSTRALGWVDEEIDTWIEKKMADRDASIAGGTA